MATGGYEVQSGDVGDNAEVTADTPRTTTQADKKTTLSPWVVTKAKLKMAAGTKNASKSSKRRAGGGKTKKKGVGKTRPDGEQALTMLNAGIAADPQSPASHSHADSDVESKSPVTSSDTKESFQQNSEEQAVREAMEVLYVT